MNNRTTTGPSDIGDEIADIDVRDTDELQEHLLAFVEDSKAGDADAMENRALALLAGARRAKAQDGDCDE